MSFIPGCIGQQGVAILLQLPCYVFAVAYIVGTAPGFDPYGLRAGHCQAAAAAVAIAAAVANAAAAAVAVACRGSKSSGCVVWWVCRRGMLGHKGGEGDGSMCRSKSSTGLCQCTSWLHTPSTVGP